MRKFFLLMAVVSVVLIVHLLFLTQWTASRYVINLAVLLVVAVTLHRGLLYGAAIALLTGLVENSMSAITGPTHAISLVVLALATWFFSAKMFSTRSAASLLFTTAMGTAVYGLVFMLSESLLTLLNHQRISVPYVAIGFATLGTVIIHPILISLLWRWRKWDRYSQVVTQL
jgi:hypothetical protein